ncbi:uncharacterized protein C8Q71DRAFT_698227 [Rhodofomes roseus]|uniref:SET domain-containing protein n=1 Tax=Rhodofomes roseus TaxID=34475 RepID=A0ABQ8KWP5_9APHY|nr:uncharacterized protein C8Q71DRAFT_698227 [Rhodofomes roseus]KAH9843722.1 hypothetical protein C8Q71DRAFT_698227 [Rhodofomes roseus]
MIGTRAELEHIIPFGEVALKKPLPSNGGERPFRVQETEQKGLGMFATRVIKAGELVLAERPTVLSPRDSLGNKYFAPLEPAFYDAALAALSEGARAAFMTLVDRCSLGKRAHPLAGRIMTNGFTAGNLLGEDAEDNPQDVVFAATYLLISRANHDCIPNAHYHWHRARWCGQLHATRDIAAGEEITVKYTTLTTHAERQAFFQKQYSCSCLCRTCLDASPEDVRRSDERREAVVQLLCRLENALDPSAYPLLQDSEERAVRRTLECARREGMMFQYANILHQGSRIMQMQDSPLVAFDWLKEARRAYAMILGEDSIGVVQVDDIGQYLVDRMRARGMQCSWP